MKLHALAAVCLLAITMTLASCSKKGPTSIDEYFHRAVNEHISLIDQHIKDPQKHARCMRQMDRLGVLMRDFAIKLKKESSNIEVLMLDYGTTRATFETSSKAFDSEHEAFLDELQDIRGELRRLMTQEEWARTSRRSYQVLSY